MCINDCQKHGQCHSFKKWRTKKKLGEIETDMGWFLADLTHIVFTMQTLATKGLTAQDL